MNKMRHSARTQSLPALALIAGLVFAPGAASAEPSITAAIHSEQPVNINISFGAEVPLPALSEDTLAAARKAGREYAYRLGREECALLMATIAKTCRLVDISTSADLAQRYYTNSPRLYFNGNASFIIDLKDAAAGR